MHPAISHVLQYLAWKLADESAEDPNPEVTVALRKLLEAKDAAVRSILPPPVDISK